MRWTYRDHKLSTSEHLQKAEKHHLQNDVGAENETVRRGKSAHFAPKTKLRMAHS